MMTIARENNNRTHMFNYFVMMMAEYILMAYFILVVSCIIDIAILVVSLQSTVRSPNEKLIVWVVVNIGTNVMIFPIFVMLRKIKYLMTTLVGIIVVITVNISLIVSAILLLLPLNHRDKLSNILEFRLIITCFFVVWPILCHPNKIIKFFRKKNSIEQQYVIQLPVYTFVNDEAIPLDCEKNARVKIDDNGCCICMDDYELNDQLRVLSCQHHFHQICCDKWLLINSTCPLCRENI